MAANEALRDIIRRSGLTWDRLARAINAVAAENGELLRTNRSSVSQWCGGKTPRPATVGYLAEALGRKLMRRVDPAEFGCPGVGVPTGPASWRLPDPVADVQWLGRADVDGRPLEGEVYSVAVLALPVDVLTGTEISPRLRAVRRGAAIGMADVEAVQQAERAWEALDERLGGGFGRSAVAEFLATDIVGLCRAPAPAKVRAAMLTAAAEVAFLLAWKSHDMLLAGRSQRYFLDSFRLAMAAGDKPLAANVMRLMARQAMRYGQGRHTLDLAETAWRSVRGVVDPQTEASFAMTVAQAHAASGDKRRALETIRRAEQLGDSAEVVGRRPDWVLLRRCCQIEQHLGRVLYDLGELAAAQRHFERGCHEDPQVWPRLHGLRMARLAVCRFQRGEVEAACATWAQAFRGLGSVRSARVRQAVGQMRGMLKPLSGKRIVAVESVIAETARLA